MNECIFANFKAVRKSLKLTQDEFGAPLGMSRDAIANIEYGRVSTIEQSRVTALCAVYNVNEHWLKTGQGEMFNKPAHTFIDELAEKYEVDDFLKRVITAYMELSENDRKTVRRYIESITPPPSGGVKIYRAASSEDDHPDEITTISEEAHDKLGKAPRTSSEESDL